MDIARGQSGPSLPGRTGTAAQEAVRHRIGRPAGRVRAGRAGRPDRTATRPRPGEAPPRGGAPRASTRYGDRARWPASGRSGTRGTRWPSVGTPRPDASCPTPRSSPPPPHRWAERDPAAAARLARCREVVNRLATTHAVPPENLLAPDAVRRLAWAPPEPAVDRRLADPAQVPARDVAAVWAALKEYGARLWQIELTATELTEALAPPAITHE